jgi:hypothetical protein
MFVFALPCFCYCRGENFGNVFVLDSFGHFVFLWVSVMFGE